MIIPLLLILFLRNISSSFIQLKHFFPRDSINVKNTYKPHLLESTSDDKDTSFVLERNPHHGNTIRVRGRATYDGSRFQGWQTQQKGRTAQGELESTLSRRFNRKVKILGASRTDAGVHAKGIF